MIMPCMNCTSAGEGGGSVALVEDGSVRVGSPGAPGCTTTGPEESACCAQTDNDDNAASRHAMIRPLVLIRETISICLQSAVASHATWACFRAGSPCY